ncbi:hypothetical protein HPS8415995_2254, partial [Glaesserella parasuis 84-15995]
MSIVATIHLFQFPASVLFFIYKRFGFVLLIRASQLELVGVLLRCHYCAALVSTVNLCCWFRWLWFLSRLSCCIFTCNTLAIKCCYCDVGFVFYCTWGKGYFASLGIQFNWAITAVSIYTNTIHLRIFSWIQFPLTILILEPNRSVCTIRLLIVHLEGFGFWLSIRTFSRFNDNATLSRVVN